MSRPSMLHVGKYVEGTDQICQQMITHWWCDVTMALIRLAEP